MRTLVITLAVLSLAACQSGSDPVVESCQKLDECNALKPGVSVDECVETLDKNLDGLTASKRTDVQGLMEGCLAFESCDGFLACVNNSGL